MFSRKKMNDYRFMILIGQLSLIFGIIGTRIFRILISSFGSSSAFFLGFLDGISVVMLMLSIVCHVRGITLYKKCEVRKADRHRFN